MKDVNLNADDQGSAKDVNLNADDQKSVHIFGQEGMCMPRIMF